MRYLTTALAAALAALALSATAQAAEEEPCPYSGSERTRCYGLASVGVSLSTSGTQAGLDPTQAGAHPDLTLDFALKEDPEGGVTPLGLRPSYAKTRDLAFELPPGLLGDPNVLGLPQQCTNRELIEGTSTSATCPNGSQVGLAKIYLEEISHPLCDPIYMMVPPGGDVVARFGINAGPFPTFINFKVRSNGDYGLTSELSDVSSAANLIKAENTFWGVPSDPVHDNERPHGSLNVECESASRPPGSRLLPFLTNPTSCGPGKEVIVNADSWSFPGVFDEKKTTLPEITGCDKLPFGPALAVIPTSRHTEAPSGVNATLTVPESEGGRTLATAQLRDARITLPQGLSVNPGSADGLQVCTDEQVRFGKNEAAHCPDAAKLAFAEFDIPALARKMKGAVYLRPPEPGHLFRAWLVADDLGAHVKLPAELEVNPQTGRITTLVLDLPQTPLREAKFFFKSGFRAPLATPRACGTYNTDWTFTPWSGTPPVSGISPLKIDEGCDTGGFSPKLRAGTTSPQAGTYSPFVFDLTREDGEQNPASLDVTLPPGLVAKLAGVPPCEGTAAETGNCPEASRIGRVLTAVGPGPAPLWAPQPGKDPLLAYLAGPYKGAPLSMVVKAPAQAGPFDLGVIVVRSAIYVDPETAKVTVKSDPLPQIIEGIPLDYRHIIVDLNREGFSLNPTSCNEMAVGAKVTSFEGAVANPSSRFQVGGCRGLDFKPSLSLKLKGGTRRGAHPKLKAVVKMPAGDANIAGAKVTLPHSEFLDQGHLNNICTRVQFAAKECPQASIYGYAVAKTPLFDQPLEGPVYLRASSHLLPDLVAALEGPASQPVEVDLDGRVDSVNGGIRNTFEVVPDAPVEEFTLEMQGGSKGLLVNSENLCAKTSRAVARFSGQNGKVHNFEPVVQNSCHRAPRKHGHGHKRHRRHRRR